MKRGGVCGLLLETDLALLPSEKTHGVFFEALSAFCGLCPLLHQAHRIILIGHSWSRTRLLFPQSFAHRALQSHTRGHGLLHSFIQVFDFFHIFRRRKSRAKRSHTVTTSHLVELFIVHLAVSVKIDQSDHFVIRDTFSQGIEYKPDLACTYEAVTRHVECEESIFDLVISERLSTHVPFPLVDDFEIVCLNMLDSSLLILPDVIHDLFVCLSSVDDVTYARKVLIKLNHILFMNFRLLHLDGSLLT